MIFVGWILFSLIVGFIASSYCRSGGGWFVLSLIISPLLAGLFLLLAGRYHHPSLEEVKGSTY